MSGPIKITDRIVSVEEAVKISINSSPRTVGEYIQRARDCLDDDMCAAVTRELSSLSPESFLDAQQSYSMMRDVVPKREQASIEPLRFTSRPVKFKYDPRL